MNFRFKSAVTTLLLLLFVSVAGASEYVGHRLDGQTLTVDTSNGALTLTALQEGAFEAHYQPQGVKQLPSFAIAGEPVEAKVSLQESEDSLRFTNGALTAEINKQPLRIRYLQQGKVILEEELGLFVQDTVRGFRFKLQEGEKLMGGGQRVLGMDRRGHRLPLYNRAHYGYETESKQMYYGMPAVMSSNKYVLIFDNSASGHMDLGATEQDILQFEAVGGRTSYIVTAADSYPALIENFVGVTGKQPLPPRWALGNFASRFGYRSEQEARDTVQKFIDLDFPLDGIVLDLYWFGADITGHMGSLDWDRETFPTAEDMIADFKDVGVKTIVITEPFILTTSTKWDSAVESQALATNHVGEPRTFDFFFGNTGLVDVFNDKGRDWFWAQYERLANQGISGWWGDLGEPEVHPGDSIHSIDGLVATGDEVHNAYGHEWAKLVYEGLKQHAPDERPFIMMRSGFVGSQRYGMIPWTGDVARSWGGFKPQVELSLQMGLMGMAYNHSDLGGFAGGDKFDSELYTRWLQYGAFQPVYRPHAQENIAPEPVFHDRKTQERVRKFIKLRYRMMPYNYSLTYENSMTGLPMMRPLFFEDETNEAFLAEKDTYLWGDAFLVKPVTDKGAREVEMMLPEGVWFNFWNDDRHQGGQTIEVDAPLNELPVMVRAGSFVPTVDNYQTTDVYSTAAMNLHYYADASVESASGVMYEDDGKDPNAIAEGQFETLRFNAGQQGNTLELNLSREGQYQGMPQSRELNLVVHNWDAQPDQIMVNGTAVKLVSKRAELGNNTALFNKKLNQLVVKFNWQQDTVVSIK